MCSCSTFDDSEKYLSKYLEGSSKLSVLLDYDGTLTPIVAHPDLATIPPETKDILERLSRNPGIFVAIISGRAVDNVKSMVGIDSITYAGNHGDEEDRNINDEVNNSSNVSSKAENSSQEFNNATKESYEETHFLGIPINDYLASTNSLGGFIYSVVNKTGKTITEAGSKIIQSIDNSILTDFSREHDEFVRAKNKHLASPLPPWVGYSNEEVVKDECLSLSTDRRNFIRSPPAGTKFNFDYKLSYPVAMAMMEQDSNLTLIRYELVPKIISEEHFWRNYFYRISLICKVNDVNYKSDIIQDKRLNNDNIIQDKSRCDTADLNELTEEFASLGLELKEINEEKWNNSSEPESLDYCEDSEASKHEISDDLEDLDNILHIDDL